MRTAHPHTGVRVDDILARKIEIQWAEAVALVQATCRQITVTRAAGFPAASQVVLYEEGAVVALATTPQQQARGAARLLASLLGDDVPLRLRLILSEGADGGYTTLHDFFEALARFERPNPEIRLRELHRRAALAPARAGNAQRPDPPVPATPKERPASARKAKVNRWVIAAAAAAVVCLAVRFFGGRLGLTKPLAGASSDLQEERPAALRR
jgi:hypothetical protein